MVVTIDATDKHLEIFNSLNIPYEPVAKPPKPVHDMDTILTGVAGYFGREPKDLFNRTRETVILLPRQVTTYLQKKHLNKKWNEMQDYWQIPKDTIRHSVRTISNLAQYDKEIKEHLTQIQEKLEL